MRVVAAAEGGDSSEAATRVAVVGSRGGGTLVRCWCRRRPGGQLNNNIDHVYVSFGIGCGFETLRYIGRCCMLITQDQIQVHTQTDMAQDTGTL